MAEKKKEKMSTWDYVWDKIADVFAFLTIAGGIGGAGYAVYNGWGILGAVVGLFGGFFAVCLVAAVLIATPFVLVNGWTSFFGKSKPAYTNQQLHNIAWYSWLSGK